MISFVGGRASVRPFIVLASRPRLALSATSHVRSFHFSPYRRDETASEEPVNGAETTRPANADSNHASANGDQSLAARLDQIRTRPNKLLTEKLTVQNSLRLRRIVEHLFGTWRMHDLPAPSHRSESSNFTDSFRDVICTRSVESESQNRSILAGHHLVYFSEVDEAAQLAPDGADASIAPGEPFTRRLWAGGEIRLNGPGFKPAIMRKFKASCLETVESVALLGVQGEDGAVGEEEEAGQMSPGKVMVKISRKYSRATETRINTGPEATQQYQIEERRSFAFVQKPQGSSPTPAPRSIKYPHAPEFSVTVRPSSYHLFQFSALSYNAHPIHYDREYAKSVEGYRDLVVQGPFAVVIMLSVLTSVAKTLRFHTGVRRAIDIFSYRNIMPLYVDEDMTIHVRKSAPDATSESALENAAEDEKWQVWIEGPDGGLAVKATASMRQIRRKTPREPTNVKDGSSNHSQSAAETDVGKEAKADEEASPEQTTTQI